VGGSFKSFGYRRRGVKRVKALVFNGYIRLLIDHITNVGDKLSNYNLDMM
jgi:hypothetical protein